MEKPKIRVLVVDDSLVSQKLYKQLINSDMRFDLVGIAGNGQEAIDCVIRLNPDVVSMDIQMPGMDGVEATRTIMQIKAVPILIVSGLYQTKDVGIAMEVLRAGAVGIIPKPYGPGHPRFEQDARNYLNMLRLMSEVKVITRKRDLVPTRLIRQDHSSFSGIKPPAPGCDYGILVIGASAGGPEGVRTILEGLSPELPVPVLIVQHIDPHFAEGYGAWLATTSVLPIKMVFHQETLLPGCVYLQPGNKHLVIPSLGKVTVTDDPPINGNRPSVASLFQSAARNYGSQVVAVLLSGMGRDGAAELKYLRDIGAYTFAQDEQSCMVFGMPGEAIRLGGAIRVLPPDTIANELNQLLNNRKKI